MIEELIVKFPKSFYYFEEFYNEKNYVISFENFKVMPFSFQLGVFLSFFDSINTDVQLFAIAQEALEESVKEAFSTYEEYHFLDS